MDQHCVCLAYPRSPQQEPATPIPAGNVVRCRKGSFCQEVSNSCLAIVSRRAFDANVVIERATRGAELNERCARWGGRGCARRNPRIRAGVLVGIRAGVGVTVGVSVGLGVLVGTCVEVGAAVGALVGSGAGVEASLRIVVGTGVGDGVAVCVPVGTGVGEGTLVVVLVGIGVKVTDGEAVIVGVRASMVACTPSLIVAWASIVAWAFGVGVPVGIASGIGVGGKMACAAEGDSVGDGATIDSM